ncbi:MAG: hypothetical protein R2708_17090 [Vicinamibacterales bacterium]
MLVFIESCGATAYDRDDLAATLAAPRARFAEDVARSGRQVVSAFVGSPTFGGSSWLAHVTLMSGVETRDEDTNATLMAQRRDTLVTTFERAGYRTVALMPGLRHQWPEGAFYGFDQIYDTAAIDYRGPRFGWWTVPDQFALARLDVLEAAAGSDAPRFIFSRPPARTRRSGRPPLSARLGAPPVRHAVRRPGAGAGPGPQARLPQSGAELRQRRHLRLRDPRRLPRQARRPRPGGRHRRRSPAGGDGLGRGRAVGRARPRGGQPGRPARPPAGARLPRRGRAAAPLAGADAHDAAGAARRVRRSAPARVSR